MVVVIDKFIITPVISIYDNGKLVGEQRGQSLVHYVAKELNISSLKESLEKDINGQIKDTTTSKIGRSKNPRNRKKI